MKWFTSFDCFAYSASCEFQFLKFLKFCISDVQKVYLKKYTIKTISFWFLIKKMRSDLYLFYI